QCCRASLMSISLRMSHQNVSWTAESDDANHFQQLLPLTMMEVYWFTWLGIWA
ncbi:Hypothetical predicted protein, partial [Scomber scombrus]